MTWHFIVLITILLSHYSANFCPHEVMGTAKSARYKNVVPLAHLVYTFYQVPSADRADVELKL